MGRVRTETSEVVKDTECGQFAGELDSACAIDSEEWGENDNIDCGSICGVILCHAVGLC